MNLVDRNGARTEIPGGLIYPVQMPPDMPMFQNEDAALTLIHSISAYQGNRETYLRETQNGQTTDFTRHTWYGGRMGLSLFP